MKLSKSDLFRAGTIFLIVLLAHANFLFPLGAENPDSNFIYPFLSAISSPGEYISKLFTLETIDFQPVRDLTLFIDVWSLEHYKVNVSIFINSLIWAFSCWIILTIIDRFIRVVNRKTSLLIVSCYAVYPLFLQSINWGISRKHLLAFMFTLLATRAFLEWLETQKGQIKIIIFYTLSVLSLPMSVGWPVWCLCYVWLTDKEKLKNSRYLFTVLNVIMILLVVINYAYYKTSYTYLELYPRKANIITPTWIGLGLGQQFWQIIFPYQQSFHYTFRNGAVAGLSIFLAGMAFFIWRYRERKDLWVWLLYSAAHVSIILSTPTVYYDTYTLSPTFGLLIFTLLLAGPKIEKFRLVLIPFFLFWFGFTFSQNTIWKSTESFFSNSFNNDESCPNAIGLGFAKYGKKEKIPNNIFDFIQVNQCFVPGPGDSPAMMLKKLIFESMSLFYEDEIDLEYRKQRLLELGKNHFFPLTVYAALASQEENDEEIEIVMRKLNKSFEGTNIKLGNDLFFMKILPEYCERKQLPECLKFVRSNED